jgi:hypothetical protein
MAADIDQRLTIGDLLCLASHRKTEMAADMHLLDIQSSRLLQFKIYAHTHICKAL